MKSKALDNKRMMDKVGSAPVAIAEQPNKSGHVMRREEAMNWMGSMENQGKRR